MSQLPHAEEDVVRVRFAPSPTGYLHIGGARTALFNWLFARSQGGTFVLRVEDTDGERSSRGFEASILEDLRWLGLDWDEGPDVGGEHGPYRQSQRLHLYEEAAQRLFKNDMAYYCFCAPQELEASRAEARAAGRPWRYDGRCRRLSKDEREAYHLRGRGAAIRIKAPLEGETVVDDGLRGPVSFANRDVFDDFVLVRSNGRAAYNFAVVVDDVEMSISHVIRGDDHLSNTPRQLFIYEALEMEAPRFIHLPLILGPDGERLSKRHGATSVAEFREQGFLPAGMVNYLARLGWSYDGETEIFTRDELVEAFSLERVSTNPAIFDWDKARWVNGHHLRELPLAAFVALATPYLQEAGWYDPTASEAETGRVRTILAEVQDRLRSVAEVVNHVDYFFADVAEYDESGVKKHFKDAKTADYLEAVAGTLAAVDPWEREAIEQAVRDLIDRLDVGSRKVIHPTRLAVSGRTFTPGLFITLELIGREACVARLNRAGAYVRERAAANA